MDTKVGSCSDSSFLEAFLIEKGWELRHKEIRAERKATYVPHEDLSLGAAPRLALTAFPDGIYGHQHKAIKTYLDGENLAVTTPTASGKTLVFSVCALEELQRNPKARIAAIYPLKALASEQFERWQKTVADSGLGVKVGRIDGGVSTLERAKILAESRVVVFTPDIIHAWLLSVIATPAALDFLRNLSLIVVDEAHTYSGVFGSNSAFLFRRLLHASRKLGTRPRFIASSATIESPDAHLTNLTGEMFKVIDSSSDTSPRAELTTLLVVPPRGQDLLSAVSDLVVHAAANTNHQSITFVDSRKQTEYLATIVERRVGEEAEDGDEIDYTRLRELQIYPYRSGYEEDDRRRIQSRLGAGSLKGVVSTSALEMGIDLPFLTLGILLGIPRSATSLYQRVGRIGRRKGGIVVVINNGSVVSEAVFREPERFKSLPLAQSALYLHNQRIQYIHAMCLARPGGEDETVCDDVNIESDPFSSPLTLPVDFLLLCSSERVGEVISELQPMKAQAGDDPNHTFPLRDLDVQFKVEHRHGPNLMTLGSLSYSQLLREAYPGAVYYYQTRAYRVVRVKKQQRTVEVRPERKYFTTPVLLPPLILPNMVGENIYQAKRFGDLLVMECAMQVGEAVVGFKERRGNNELDVAYPLSATQGLFHDAPRFARYSFTSGVVLTHPALHDDEVKCSSIAEVMDEAFLLSLPFDRQDVNAASDRHRATRDGVNAGDRFICIYDQTYGSLRLTSHLMKTEVLRAVFEHACEIARLDPNLQLSTKSLAALEAMSACVAQEAQDVLGTASVSANPDHFISIVMPGSVGIDIHKDNDEFEIAAVFYSPVIGKVAYRGCYVTDKKKVMAQNRFHTVTTVTVPAHRIQALAGESKTGYFNLETGEVVEQLPVAGEF